MKFAEAFSRLGYDLRLPRLHWSSSNDTGVAITLWRSEIDWKSKPLTMDTLRHCGPPETWNPAGNNQRIRDLAVALEKFDGWIDVVIVDGVPGEGVDKATPWTPPERQGLKWRVRNFDPESGHFIAEAIAPV